MAFNNRRAFASIPHRKFHVFLSFRGPDTREGFVEDLYNKLLERAIVTFRDDPDLEKGTYIKELMMAIKQSRFAIVVLSKDYAFSTWCLRELAHIVRCMKQSGRIIPIFYHVDPSESFAEYFANHEKAYASSKDEETYGKDGKGIHEWRRALKTLGGIAGWATQNYRNFDETTFIGEIVDQVWAKVHTTVKLRSGPSIKSLGGVYEKLKGIDLILNTQSNDIRLIGIWGKDVKANTITAQLVLDRISDTFEVNSFLREIRKLSKDKSLVYLQRQLLGLLGRPAEVSDVCVGNGMIKSCVRNRKVLSILDDVDQSDQFHSLGGEQNWYGQGSRIIFTSTNRALLETYGVRYLVEGLNEVEALQFSN